MTTDELDRALRQLRLSGMAETLTVRTQQARAESLGPHDFLGLLVHDELQRRRDRLIERRIKEAGFRDHKSLDPFNWSFNPGIDRALIFELATGRFIEQHDDCLILGNAGVGKSHIAQAIGVSAIHAGFRVLYEPAAVVRHIGGGSGTSDGLYALWAVNTVRYYRRYHARPASAIFALEAALHQLLRGRRPGARLALRALLS